MGERHVREIEYTFVFSVLLFYLLLVIMGVHGGGSSKKRSRLSSRKLGRLKHADQKKKKQIVGEIIDAELTTEAHLYKRRTSARANITLSGKKKRKLNKVVKRLEKKKSAMAVETEAPEKPSTSVEMADSEKSTKKKSKKFPAKSDDVEMMDE